MRNLRKIKIDTRKVGRVWKGSRLENERRDSDRGSNPLPSAKFATVDCFCKHECCEVEYLDGLRAFDCERCECHYPAEAAWD